METRRQGGEGGEGFENFQCYDYAKIFNSSIPMRVQMHVLSENRKYPKYNVYLVADFFNFQTAIHLNMLRFVG